MKRKHIFIVLILVTLCILANDVLAQCPMCKASLTEARKNGTEVGSTLNMGILYLLALPYSIATVFGVLWYRNTKRKKLQHGV
jgi:uncharacterized paraquat-inducible protein A